MDTKKNSELVTNATGGVYHLNLHSNEIADNIILVGDPGRVKKVSSYFDKVEVHKENREIITETGYYRGVPISVISTGMGTDNIDIVVNELDVLANFNLESKTEKKDKKTLNLIRIGTCGALRSDIPLNTPIISRYTIGLDGLLYFYDTPTHVLNPDLADKFSEFTNWNKNLPKIYGCKSSESLDIKFDEKFLRGITITAPGFYGPQGRNIRLPLKYPELNSKMGNFEYKNCKVSNMEMESSALYGLGQSLGHNTITICIAIANRANGEFISDYSKGMENLITSVLNSLTE
ncbi:MAG: nucleoside phosphorylase [Bacteroidales bacterium]|jgi:uridine phosphorylase|nr:nucleoside phosphorylase [Bacteroidales bacterium]